MAVVFTTFEQIEIDGIPAGNIVDVISNHPQRRTEVLAAFGAFIDKLKVELAAERDSLQSQLSELTADLQTAASQLEATTNQLAAANATIETLKARIDELTAVAEQPIATLSQIRVWLLRTLGVNAIKQVDAMIAAIPDELERAIAYQQWEYANNVLRDNPFVLLIADRLGLNEQQMDEAYLAATRIV